MAPKLTSLRGGSRKRLVLRAMITSSAALGRIAPICTDSLLFNEPHADRVARWCLDHYAATGKAPRGAVTSLFAQWVEDGAAKDSADGVERLLASLSLENEREAKVAPELAFETAQRVFTEARQRKLADDIEAAHTMGRPEMADLAIATYAKVGGANDAVTDLFNDESEVRATFDTETSEALVTYPGALGVFFTNVLERGKFVAFQAPEKSGKTFLLIDMAIRAVMQRRRTAFFAVGDMTRQEMKERILSRVCRRPYYSQTGGWPYTVRVPTSLKGGNFPRNGDITPGTVEFKERTFDGPIAADVAWLSCQKLIANKVRSKESYFKLACYPNDTVSAKDVHGVIKQWIAAGWVPDVVVVDYADILAPIDRRRETRDQHNETWKYLRRLSQELHGLVVTATQADAASYEQISQSKRNFSEDKRKYSHVTAIAAINVTDAERDYCGFRLEWLMRRKGERNRKQVQVAGCLDLCDPCVVSTF